MSKKRFTVYGNCQAAALASHLLAYPRFAAEYDYVPLAPNFLVSEQDVRDWLRRHQGQLDLLVAQHLPRGWRGGTGAWDVETVARALKPRRPLLRYTDIYFRGVDPLLVYPQSFSRLGHCDYLDLISLTLASLGFVDPELCAALHEAPDLLDPHEIEAVRTLAEAELLRREAGLEIQVARDLAALCRDVPAFHTFNHPANRAIDLVARRVLVATGLGDAVPQWPAGEHLHTVRFPRCASVRQTYRETDADVRCAVRLEDSELDLPAYFQATLAGLARLAPTQLLDEIALQRRDPISGIVVRAIERSLASRMALSPVALGEVGRLNARGVTPDFLLSKADPQAVGFMVDLLGVVRNTLLPRLIGSDATVLDVGAKSGAGSQLMAYLGQPASFSKVKFAVTCADIDPMFRDYSLARHPHVEYLNADAFAVGRQWDIVICSHVVEHVPEPLEFVNKLRAIARRFVLLAFPYMEDPASLSAGHLHSLGHDFLRAVRPVHHEIYEGLFWSQSLCCIALIDVRH